MFRISELRACNLYNLVALVCEDGFELMLPPEQVSNFGEMKVTPSRLKKKKKNVLTPFEFGGDNAHMHDLQVNSR